MVAASVDLAAGERPPDGGAADRLVDAVVALDQLERHDLEVEAAPSSRSRSTLPSRLRPKWKSSPTTTAVVARPVDEHPLDELARRLLRLSLVERQHDGGVDAGLRQQLELLLGIGQQSWGADSGRTTWPGGGRT